MSDNRKIVRMSPEETKKCPVCHEVKSHAEFHRNTRKKDNLSSTCKTCKLKELHEKVLQKNGGVIRSRPRRPLPEVADETGWRLRKDVERLERVFADDRFTINRQQVAARLHGHLLYAAEVCQDLLRQINHQ